MCSDVILALAITSGIPLGLLAMLLRGNSLQHDTVAYSSENVCLKSCTLSAAADF